MIHLTDVLVVGALLFSIGLYVALSPSEYAPLTASTQGTGEVLRAALDAGVRHVVIGIGGSATNDGGRGLLEALV